jgi:CRP/FNR family transcriptional regulator
VLIPVASHSSAVSRETVHTGGAAPRPLGEEHRTLLSGEILFREGDARTHVYRVETGAVCVYRCLPDGAQDVIEFAFPGDLIGLGYLGAHVSAAQATMITTLACIPLSALDAIVEQSARARSRLAAAIEREVAYVKDTLVRNGRPAPLQRVAALFVTLSRYNTYEGREPSVITDSLTCGAAAGHLGMSVDALAHELAELQARGLIEPHEKGVRLLDIEALERLGDGLDDSPPL